MSLVKQAKKLTTKGRKQISSGNFVFEKTRRYPIHDRSHAMNALSRVAQHGTPSEKAQVRREVKQKFPGIGNKTASVSDYLKTAGSAADAAAKAWGPNLGKRHDRLGTGLKIIGAYTAGSLGGRAAKKVYKKLKGMKETEKQASALDRLKLAAMSHPEAQSGLQKAHASIQRKLATPGGASHAKLQRLSRGIKKNYADPDHPGKTASVLGFIKGADVLEDDLRDLKYMVSDLTRDIDRKKDKTRSSGSVIASKPELKVRHLNVTTGYDEDKEMHRWTAKQKDARTVVLRYMGKMRPMGGGSKKLKKKAATGRELQEETQGAKRFMVDPAAAVAWGGGAPRVRRPKRALTYEKQRVV